MRTYPQRSSVYPQRELAVKMKKHRPPSFLLFVLIWADIYTLSLSHKAISLPSLINFSCLTSKNQSIGPINDANCVGGVCPIPSEDKIKFQNTDDQPDSKVNGNSIEEKPSILSGNGSSNFEESLQELLKMGWPENDAAAALVRHSNDIVAAAEHLETEQLNDFNKKNLTASGWKKEAAEEALAASNQNLTEAIAILQAEEDGIREQFEEAVEGMVQNGWEEFVARQALLAQWSVDQARAAGQNITIDEEEVKAIRPTLKQKPKPKPSPEEIKGNSKSTSTPTTPKKKPAAPSPSAPPIKKEDFIIDVTMSNLQKVVFESPIPVILDVYADWCGPCKQLGPILESAVIKSGGMFRLAKVNNDKERGIVEALGVTGLPTVFAVTAGRLTDMFVGYPPQEQLQSFLVRMITGFGELTQPDRTSEKALLEQSAKLQLMAGMASMTFSKKEKLKGLVTAALSLPGAVEAEGQGGDSTGAFAPHRPTVGVQTALAYLQNAIRDIRNPKFRMLNCSSGHNSTFETKVLSNAAATQLLVTAGFDIQRLATTGPDPDPSADEEAVRSGEGMVTGMRLKHNNVAILTLVSQLANDHYGNLRREATRRKAASASSAAGLTQSAATSGADGHPVGTTTASSSPWTQASNVARLKSEASIKKKEAVEQKKDARKLESKSGLVTVSLLLPDKQVLKKSFEPTVSTADAVQTLLQDSTLETSSWSTVTVRYPLPQREILKDSEQLGSPLASLFPSSSTGSKSVSLVISLVKSSGGGRGEGQGSSGGPVSRGSRDKRGSGEGNAKKGNGIAASFASLRSKIKNRTNTLFSTGILSTAQQKHNEYFGGDSTVFLAGEEKGVADGEGGEVKGLDGEVNAVESVADSSQEEESKEAEQPVPVVCPPSEKRVKKSKNKQSSRRPRK